MKMDQSSALQAQGFELIPSVPLPHVMEQDNMPSSDWFFFTPHTAATMQQHSVWIL